MHCVELRGGLRERLQDATPSPEQCVRPVFSNRAIESQTMRIEPYLFFDGRCEEALNFYRQALGAEVEIMMRYKESPEPPPPEMVAPGSEEKVMHASFRVGPARVMASDGGCQGTARFEGFSLSLAVESPADADRYFSALAEGGQVQMPLMQTFFARRFGMVMDRFGVSWMVIVDQ